LAVHRSTKSSAQQLAPITIAAMPRKQLNWAHELFGNDAVRQ
jgi:hypothetical protein